jgi:6-phosphogluconolactonase (cycloisomerase 2 family)
MNVKLTLQCVALWAIAAMMLPLGGCNGGPGKFGPPPPPTSEFVVATSNNQVASFGIDANTGALGAAVTAAGPSSSGNVAVSPSGKFVYVSDAVNTALDVYSFNSSSGALVPVTGSPFPLGTIAFSLSMDSAGKFLYAVDGVNGNVFGFTLSASTGGITTISGSPFPTANGPTKAVVDPSGQFLFVSDNLNSLGGISAYTIASSSGALTAVPGSPFTTLVLGGPSGLAVSPNGKFLYVADSNLNAITQMSIGATGALTTVLGSPFAAGSGPSSLVIDSSGKFLYVANNGDKTISAYTIDANTGALTAIAGSPFSSGTLSGNLVIDASGKFLYQANSQLAGASTITGFGINSTTGALTKFTAQPTAAGNGPVVITLANIQ